MKKSTALAMLTDLRLTTEDQELNNIIVIQVIDILLDYINDKEIRDKVEEIPL